MTSVSPLITFGMGKDDEPSKLEIKLTNGETRIMDNISNKQIIRLE